MVRIARVYDDPTADDGHRVLVDRLWPRGLHRDDPRIGRWLPAVAPSTELRRWYDHRAERFAEFTERYRAELAGGDAAAAVQELRRLADEGRLTLLTATKDPAVSHLPVLAEAVDAA